MGHPGRINLGNTRDSCFAKCWSGSPDPEEEVIGLVNAETAVQLSAIVFMLRDELDAVSPMLVKRTNTELKTRILHPYISRSDFWWMGFSGKSVNNWNVWINQNVFQTGLMADLSADSVNLLMKKYFKVLIFLSINIRKTAAVMKVLLIGTSQEEN